MPATAVSTIVGHVGFDNKVITPNMTGGFILYLTAVDKKQTNSAYFIFKGLFSSDQFGVVTPIGNLIILGQNSPGWILQIIPDIEHANFLILVEGGQDVTWHCRFELLKIEG